jgi:prolyl oligopeptidase
LLSIAAIDSLQKAGSRYFFRKRQPGQEQFSIFMRDGAEGEDQLLADPAKFGSGIFTALQICTVSNDGRLLAYQVREGGEDSHRLEVLDIAMRRTLVDGLPHGFVRGFAFAHDGSCFYYVHEPVPVNGTTHHAVFRHVMGHSHDEDQEIFSAGNGPDIHVTFRLDASSMVVVVVNYGNPSTIDFHLCNLETHSSKPLLRRCEGIWAPVLRAGRIFAFTDSGAPNGRIVELISNDGGCAEVKELVSEQPCDITNFGILGSFLAVSYLNELCTLFVIHDLDGHPLEEIRFPASHTVRLISQASPGDELIYESESFTQPRSFHRYIPATRQHIPWSEQPQSSKCGENDFIFLRHSYTSCDGTAVPICLVGKKQVLNAGNIAPVIMTSYGGFGVSSTPQFSVLANWMMQKGCIFALPSIRGGSEFGSAWHEAAKRRNRQNAFDDFIAAAQWLIQRGITSPDKLAIFGGSNSGLLAATAITQRPELFAACLCIAPLLDMLRYHLFDCSRRWQEEFGSADDRDDFTVLYSYSPYHNVRDGEHYPATLFVSGDADMRCNPMHVRKMVARLQAANASGRPILLDYKPQRGHAPVLPLSMRVEALTDRLAFLQHELGLTP